MTSRRALRLQKHRVRRQHTHATSERIGDAQRTPFGFLGFRSAEKLVHRGKKLLQPAIEVLLS